MRNLTYFISLLFVFNFANAQATRKRKLTIEELDAKMEANVKCLKRDVYPVDKRRLMFPFKDAAKISFISFRDTTSEFRSQIPIKNKKLDRSLVLEERILSQIEIDKLSDLIFNYGYRSRSLPRLVRNFKCYDPHNGIIFFDDKKTVEDYVEICFDCEKFVPSTNKISLGELCTEKFSLLKKLFLNNNIKKNSSEDIYPE